MSARYGGRRCGLAVATIAPLLLLLSLSAPQQTLAFCAGVNATHSCEPGGTCDTSTNLCKCRLSRFEANGQPSSTFADPTCHYDQFTVDWTYAAPRIATMMGFAMIEVCIASTAMVLLFVRKRAKFINGQTACLTGLWVSSIIRTAYWGSTLSGAIGDSAHQQTIAAFLLLAPEYLNTNSFNYVILFLHELASNRIRTDGKCRQYGTFAAFVVMTLLFGLALWNPFPLATEIFVSILLLLLISWSVLVLYFGLGVARRLYVGSARYKSEVTKYSGDVDTATGANAAQPPPPLPPLPPSPAAGAAAAADGAGLVVPIAAGADDGGVTPGTATPLPVDAAIEVDQAESTKLMPPTAAIVASKPAPASAFVTVAQPTVVKAVPRRTDTGAASREAANKFVWPIIRLAVGCATFGIVVSLVAGISTLLLDGNSQEMVNQNVASRALSTCWALTLISVFWPSRPPGSGGDSAEKANAAGGGAAAAAAAAHAHAMSHKADESRKSQDKAKEWASPPQRYRGTSGGGGGIAANGKGHGTHASIDLNIKVTGNINAGANANANGNAPSTPMNVEAATPTAPMSPAAALLTPDAAPSLPASPSAHAR